ncbi:glycoside hydrolase family 15 domain protein [mine drainage metagenome]|uniref:Glycoside hydrolase family 15 domain protein n=1 Tax=mine drainage metagenome TaxID=410659 RepID=T0ZXC4_9ZZZZ
MTRNLELGLIGNCSTCALIDEQAEFVWTCLPRFDGDPVFCSLLQPDASVDRGFMNVTVAGLRATTQHYEPNTAILVTTFEDDRGGCLEVIDFMPRFKHYERLYRPLLFVRILRPKKGRPEITVRIRPSANWGEVAPEVTLGSHHIRYVFPGQVHRLTTDVSLTAILGETPFVLDHERVLFFGPDDTLTRPLETLSREFLAETTKYWQEWVRYLAIPFEWQDAVIRAAITLKLSTFEDTGAVLAALTTSIPESANSGRNWDYRYCWLRDSYFVIRALNRLGATRTMEDYLRFVINLGVERGYERLQPVYAISGKADLPEREIQSLAGYRGMGPVRIGNAAYAQNQHDVYGAIVLAVSQAFWDQRLDRSGDRALFTHLESLGHTAARLAGQPDAGLWEIRGKETVHTFSAVLCWCALDRLARIAKRLGLADRAQFWAEQAQTLRETVLGRAWNPKRRSFTATLDGSDLDASVLLFAELGFVPVEDPRFKDSVQAVERELKHGDYVFRYQEADDFGVPKNAFTLCSFWYLKALTRLGRKEEAHEQFASLLGRRTRLGLLSEHMDPQTGELWGNFPQTYSMVGIIESAMLLSAPWEGAF